MNTKERRTEDLPRAFGIRFSKFKPGLGIPPHWGEKDASSVLWHASLLRPDECTAFDVLTALTKEKLADFEDFADQPGMDYSKKSCRLCSAIQQEAEDVTAFFSRENELNLISTLED